MKIASMLTYAAGHGAFLGLALMLCAGGASAQMYKWVDANGKTHFTDTPPPATARPAKVSGSAPGSTATLVNLPYALAAPARNHPVTLYTASACAGCDAGRTYLRGRGIPFAEKTITTEADVTSLKGVGGDGSVPYISVGSAKMAGFEAAAWDNMLKIANYPSSKVLPASYKYPAAVAAAPVAAKPAEPDPEIARRAALDEERSRANDAGAPKTSAPPGFRF